MVSDANGNKTGNQRLEDFEVEDYLELLQPLVDALSAEIPEAKYDRKSLAHLIYSILQFMEDALGINALPPKPYPKLPAQLFRDFSTDGPLFTIAKRCYEYKVRNQLKKIDFLNPQMRKSSTELLNIIRQEFVKQGLIQYPKVYLDESLAGPQIAKLKEQVLEMKGTLAESAEDQGVTHIVFPFGAKGDPDDGQQYMRTLNVMGLQAQVHWWYTPDSYDEWISQQTAPLTVEPDYDPGVPWKVYIRWLTDSFRYNEWVNPIDYETEDFQEYLEKVNIASQPHKSVGVQQQSEQEEGATKDDAQLTGSKREREEGEITAESFDEIEGGGVTHMQSAAAGKDIVTPLEVAAEEEEIVQPGVKKQKLLHANHGMMDVNVTTENISMGSNQNWVLDNQLPEYQVRNVDENQQNTKKIKKELYRVPAHSAWFRWDKVHEREQKSMPDFFTPVQVNQEDVEDQLQKLKDKYMEKRNFIIDKYREDPERFLTFSNLKQYMAGDVVSLKRIWDFLNSWGLINYFARSCGHEQQGHNVEIQAVSEKPSSSVVSATTFVPSAEALYRFTWPSVTDASKATQSGGNNVNLINKQNKLAGIKTVRDKAVYYCNAMPWVDCSNLRYHCVKFPDVDLCPEAYAKGYFPPGCSKKDFIKIDKNQVDGGDYGEWSESETLLLLEGLEMFGEKWADVAEHVGTRSQIQCIMHFLQLPIEEQFLEEGVDDNQKGVALEYDKEQYQQTANSEHEENENDKVVQNFESSALTAAQQNAAESAEADLLPFGDTNNPVMAQIAFLTSMVSPKVAAAAAQRALEVLSEEDPIVAEDPQNSLNSTSLTTAKVKAAAASALAAAAVKSKLLAENEEREIQRLVVAAVDAQMKKVEIKLKYLEELEGVMEQEKNALTNARKQYEMEASQLRTKQQETQSKLQALQLQIQQQEASTPAAPNQPQQQEWQQVTPPIQSQEISFGLTQDPQSTPPQFPSFTPMQLTPLQRSTPLQSQFQNTTSPLVLPISQSAQQEQSVGQPQSSGEQAEKSSLLQELETVMMNVRPGVLDPAVTIQGQIPQVDSASKNNVQDGDNQQGGQWITLEQSTVAQPPTFLETGQQQASGVSQQLEINAVELPDLTDIMETDKEDGDRIGEKQTASEVNNEGG